MYPIMPKNLPHHWIALIHLYTNIFLSEFIRSTSIQLVVLNIRFLPTLTSHTLKFSRLQIRWDWSRVICSSAYICTTPGTPRSSTRRFVKRRPWTWRWLPSSRGRRWWSSLKKNKRSTSPGEDSNLDLQLCFCIPFIRLITCTSHILLHMLFFMYGNWGNWGFPIPTFGRPPSSHSLFWHISSIIYDVAKALTTTRYYEQARIRIVNFGSSIFKSMQEVISTIETKT